MHSIRIKSSKADITDFDFFSSILKDKKNDLSKSAKTLKNRSLKAVSPIGSADYFTSFFHQSW